MGDTQLSALTEGNTHGGERGMRWREGGGRQAKESLPLLAEELACQLEARKSNPAGYRILVYLLLVTCFVFFFPVARCLKRCNLMGEGFVLGGDLRGETLGDDRRVWQQDHEMTDQIASAVRKLREMNVGVCVFSCLPFISPGH